MISCTRLDHSSLASGHHNALLASLVFLPDMFAKAREDHCELEHIHVLNIGLGGGALPQFINKNLHNVCCATGLAIAMTLYLILQ